MASLHRPRQLLDARAHRHSDVRGAGWCRIRLSHPLHHLLRLPPLAAASVTQFIPPQFPILLIVPAFLLELLCRRARAWNRGNSPRSALSSTVRVSVAKLRACLREYYLSEGRNAVLKIELPIGYLCPGVQYGDRASSISGPATRRPYLRRFAAVPILGAVCAVILGWWMGHWSAARPLLEIQRLTFHRGTIRRGGSFGRQGHPLQCRK